MLTLLKKYTSLAVLMAGLLLQLAACNKIPEVEEITPTEPSGQTIAEIIDGDANFSLLKMAIDKAGVRPLLNKRDNMLTLFAPDNAALTRSGISEGVINALPAAQLAAILSYHIVPQAIPSAALPGGSPLPNLQMPTLLQPLATQPLFKMSIFPSAPATGAFVNNIPIVAADRAAANGVIHTVFALVAPPTGTLKTLIAADEELSFLRAAIARADEGQTGLNRIDSLLNYAFPNITLFAPTNDAFKALLTALNLPPAEATIGMLPVAQVRGILAYHALAVNGVPAFRLFSPNLATGTVETLVGPAPMPQLTINAANPAAPTVRGAANPSASNIVAANIHGVNGVMHKIDQVLLPQAP